MTCAMCEEPDEPMTPVLIHGRRELVCSDCAPFTLPYVVELEEGA